MADISMCKGGSCPSKDTCYRYTAPITPYRQSYSNFFLTQEDGKCEWYSLDTRTTKEKNEN